MGQFTSIDTHEEYIDYIAKVYSVQQAAAVKSALRLLKDANPKLEEYVSDNPHTDTMCYFRGEDDNFIGIAASKDTIAVYMHDELLKPFEPTLTDMGYEFGYASWSRGYVLIPTIPYKPLPEKLLTDMANHALGESSSAG